MFFSERPTVPLAYPPRRGAIRLAIADITIGVKICGKATLRASSFSNVATKRRIIAWPARLVSLRWTPPCGVARPGSKWAAKLPCGFRAGPKILIAAEAAGTAGQRFGGCYG